jgi:hypothetical protein
MPTESVTRKYFSASMVALFISLAAPASARAGAEDEVRELFGKFVVAQNAHDLKAVGEILRDYRRFFGSRATRKPDAPHHFGGVTRP